MNFMISCDFSDNENWSENVLSIIENIEKQTEQKVWVYTSSFRSERYIRTLFRLYGVKFDGIINGARHLDEVQAGHSETLPNKLPNRYKISLHIDDEAIIATNGKAYGFNVFELNAQDDDWEEKIINRVFEIKRKEGL